MKNLSYLLFIFALTLGGYNVHASEFQTGVDADESSEDTDIASLFDDEGKGNKGTGVDAASVKEIVKAAITEALEENKKEGETTTATVPNKEEVEVKEVQPGWGKRLYAAKLRGTPNPEEFPTLTLSKLSGWLKGAENLPEGGVAGSYKSEKYEGYLHVYRVQVGKLNGTEYEFDTDIPLSEYLAKGNLKEIFRKEFEKDSTFNQLCLTKPKDGDEDWTTKSHIKYVLTSTETEDFHPVIVVTAARNQASPEEEEFLKFTN